MPALIRYESVVYGPVKSRRLGVSLGLNLLPPNRKICSFDCVYCECGDTTELVTNVARRGFPSVEQVVAELEAALQQWPDVEALTFAGHGEPTIHPQFSAIVQAVRAVRDRMTPQAKVCVLTSAALVGQPRIQAGLDGCDVRMMKLDAGDEATFHAIDRPAANVTLAGIVAQLQRMPNIVIQTCLMDGPVQNVRGPQWDALVEAVGLIKPLYVQLYPVERPTPEAWVEKITHTQVAQLAADMQARTGVVVEPY